MGFYFLNHKSTVLYLGVILVLLLVNEGGSRVLPAATDENNPMAAGTEKQDSTGEKLLPGHVGNLNSVDNGNAESGNHMDGSTGISATDTDKTEVPDVQYDFLLENVLKQKERGDKEEWNRLIEQHEKHRHQKGKKKTLKNDVALISGAATYIAGFVMLGGVGAAMLLTGGVFVAAGLAAMFLARP